MITVRLARPSDGSTLGEIHAAAWKAAYRGVMPDEVLDSRDPVEMGRSWTETLTSADRVSEVSVAELDSNVVAMSAYGPSRDAPEDTTAGELWMINAHPNAFGTGAGTALIAHVVSRLRHMGYSSAVLWVVRENARARSFYEREGWAPDGVSKSEDFGGVEVTEVRYRVTL